MPLSAVERRLQNRKKNVSRLSRNAPSVSEMADGDERPVLTSNKELRVYRKEAGKLWYVNFTKL